MILPDFQNMYTNMSNLSREQQVRQFRMLVEMIQERISDIKERNMQISLHGLLYSILSESPYAETIFMAADVLYSQLLGVYLEQLRPDNILVTTELNDTMDYMSEEYGIMLKDYLDMLAAEMPKQFTIMIFPYRMLEGNIDMWLGYIDNMLAYKGRIILYDCPARLPGKDRFELVIDDTISSDLTIKMLKTRKEFLPGDNIMELSLRARRLHEDIKAAIDKGTIDSTKLDSLIYDIWRLEGDILKYKDEFRDSTVGYQVNEIKNALLDLRYSEEKNREFFIEALRKETDILPKFINYVY